MEAVITSHLESVGRYYVVLKFDLAMAPTPEESASLRAFLNVFSGPVDTMVIASLQAQFQKDARRLHPGRQIIVCRERSCVLTSRRELSVKGPQPRCKTTGIKNHVAPAIGSLEYSYILNSRTADGQSSVGPSFSTTSPRCL